MRPVELTVFFPELLSGNWPLERPRVHTALTLMGALDAANRSCAARRLSRSLPAWPVLAVVGALPGLQPHWGLVGHWACERHSGGNSKSLPRAPSALPDSVVMTCHLPTTVLLRSISSTSRQQPLRQAIFSRVPTARKPCRL